MKRNTGIAFILFMQCVFAQKASSSLSASGTISDTYTNPILNLDYSDPDAIRVGDKFYMTASSFNCIPGLPILESYDLVNWELTGYALQKQPPFDVYSKPQHGNGVWAPCIRYHNNTFHIYYPDPDYGIYVVKAKQATGPWSEPVLVKEGKGLIDPAPFWDDNGKAYLVYAFAGSRAGFKSVLAACTMNGEGTQANTDDRLVYDGHVDDPTIEGPKVYKRNGYYYIFAPAGGVPTGWQTVLRSKDIFGPYERRTVMDQGKTKVNGPHQGAWVQTSTGEDWFIHFQDKGVLGRVVHLQPMKWVNDWPVIGEDKDNNGTGQPVTVYKKPVTGKANAVMPLALSDEFSKPETGLQWQWHANPEIGWGFPGAYGYYTFNCIPKPKDAKNLFDVPNLLLQKFPNEDFTAIAKCDINFNFDKEEAGIVIMGLDYCYLRVIQENNKLYLSQQVCTNADKGTAEKEVGKVAVNNKQLYLKVDVTDNGNCSFSYSEDGKKFKTIGERFKAREGKWIGAKLGFTALREGFINNAGNMKVDWIRINLN